MGCARCGRWRTFRTRVRWFWADKQVPVRPDLLTKLVGHSRKEVFERIAVGRLPVGCRCARATTPWATADINTHEGGQLRCATKSTVRLRPTGPSQPNESALVLLLISQTLASMCRQGQRQIGKGEFVAPVVGYIRPRDTRLCRMCNCSQVRRPGERFKLKAETQKSAWQSLRQWQKERATRGPFSSGSKCDSPV